MKSKYIFIITLFVVLALWFSTPFIVKHYFSVIAERGQFGDIFGSINALFSGLAFSGLIYTIFLQREEISKLEKSQKESEKILKAQAFSLEQSAKLSAISILYNHYSIELESFPANWAQTSGNEHYLDVSNKLQELRNAANNAYQDLVNKK